MELPSRVQATYRWNAERWERWNPAAQGRAEVNELHREGLERAIYLR